MNKDFGYAERAFSIAKKMRFSVFSRKRDVSEQKVIFVCGVQRSGTTLLMRIFDRSWSTAVFHEHFKSAYHRNSLRELNVLQDIAARSGAEFVIFKALNDSFRLSELLETFAESRAIWAFRYYDAVVNSILKRWPGERNRIDEIVSDPESGGWRGRGMSQATLNTLRQLYRKDMSDASAEALFWLHRNQLLFDQNLHTDSRVILSNYEALVTNPKAEIAKIQKLTGISFTAAMYQLVSSASLKKGEEISKIDPAIRTVCDQMYNSLCNVWIRQGSPPG